VNWYGTDNFNDYALNNQRTLALLNYTRKAGLKFSICYEDQTIRHEIDGGYITAANAISHAQLTLLYAQSNFFNDASSLRLSNAPVFLNFGPQFFKTNLRLGHDSLRPGRNESTRFLYRGPPSGRWPWRVQLAADVDEWRRHQHSDTHPITILPAQFRTKKPPPGRLTSAAPFRAFTICMLMREPAHLMDTWTMPMARPSLTRYDAR